MEEDLRRPLDEALLEAARHPRAFERARHAGRPVFLRRAIRPGWRAKLPLYVLWCEDCGRYTVTHPAGYGRIHCAGCRRHEKVMTWQRFRDKPVGAGYAYLLAIIFLLLAACLRW
ncbi:MAG TPA: hypothetical protein VLC10_03445 [Patescibacteria group bacterium]|nr:hypothetical protein [Patescibacteria group bacterium]